MSGPAIHHIIAKEYLRNILKSKYNDPASMAFWNKMEAGESAPIYHLGAQWPDFLFFNVNDWESSGGVKTIAQAFFEVQDFKEDFVKKVKNIIPAELWSAISTLENLADDAVERSATLSAIKGLVTDVKNNIELLKTLTETKIEEFVTDSFDVFSLLKHPQQHGQKYSDWWWFDTLHIRRSGRFLNELMKQSSEYSPERAFALGCLTHYATDTVGHPFVNAISGGPYRTHGQRHKVVENHHDVWAYSRNNNGAEFIKSNLAAQYIINGDSKKLPDNLKNYILSCLNKVYYDGSNPVYGKKISGSDLDMSYRCWLKWFTMTTNDMELPVPQPYSLNNEIIAAWNKFTKNCGSIANLGNSAPGSSGITGLLNILAALIAGPFLLAAALIDFILGEITTLGTAPMKYFLSLTYEALYNSYMNFRQGLVLNGFAFPLNAQLNHYAVSHMINSGDRDICGNNAMSLPNANLYPANKFNGMGAESHLIYPWPNPGNGEIDTCTGFPTSYLNKDPSWYMTGMGLSFKQSKYEEYRRFTESKFIDNSEESIPSITGKFLEFAKLAKNGGLGNAVAFSDALYAEYLRGGRRKNINYIDFNLDSDRGYAFKCWRKVEDIKLLNSPINDYRRTNVPIEEDKKVLNVLNILTDIIEADMDPEKGTIPLPSNNDLKGWVDMHTHPMVNLGFGGKLVHGAPDIGSMLPTDNSGNRNVRVKSMEEALCDDRSTHAGLSGYILGDEIRSRVIDKMQEKMCVTPDRALGFPDFHDWPMYNDITHQKMWVDWIEKAYKGGLRVMVALALNNQTLAAAVSGFGDGPTDDKGSGDLQIEEIKSFVGRHSDFMEMAYSSADLRRIVQSNKLGVVLGIELDAFGDFDKKTNPTLTMVEDELLRLYVNGVRYIFPIHAIDNKLGGTAIYDGTFNTSNYREHGHYWEIMCSSPEDKITYRYAPDPFDPAVALVKVVKLGIDPGKEPPPPPNCDDGIGHILCKNCNHKNENGIGHMNSKNLDPLGRNAIMEMMKLGMLIDIDHMSQRSADETLALAEAVDPGVGYPLNSGHNGPRSAAPEPTNENQRTEKQLLRIAKLGGMLGLGIGSDKMSAEFFIKNYGTAGREMQGQSETDFNNFDTNPPPICLGTDINGIVMSPPKPDKESQIYNEDLMKDEKFFRCTTGNKTWDYDKEGVAHYGMLPDFLRAVKLYVREGEAQGEKGKTEGEIVYDSINKSAGQFIKMWEKCENQKSKVK